MLDKAPEEEVEETTQHEATGEGGAQHGGVGGKGSFTSSQRIMTRFERNKLQHLERHLTDYKKVIEKDLDKVKKREMVLVIDDFYLIPIDVQSDVIDYLHKLLRGVDCHLKVATIRHRTLLSKDQDGQTIGVELRQDVEDINLDKTLEDVESTQEYLYQMILAMAERVGVEEIGDLFNRHALNSLALASGGVPRDFLNIFVYSVESARLRTSGGGWLTPTDVYKGAKKLFEETKLINLRSDARGDAERLEKIFQDLVRFCLEERKKTAFLVDKSDIQQFPKVHEVLQQLMDFKLIHLIDPDTSAASGRGGRFEAYTLDFAIFMEPRRKNIELVEFWRVDEQRRRVGVREAPIYSLERGSGALEKRESAKTEDMLNGD